jgi:hypothetical protein
LRTPSPAVDSAERLEPIGTALPAPTEQPTLPTPMPTAEPEPTALGFTGEAPEVSGLPTVAAPQDAGPTPTPRLIALPTAVPAAAVPPAVAPPPPTLPPAVPVDSVPADGVPVDVVPVEVLAPVERAPTAAPAAEDSQQVQSDSQPTPAAEAFDDDPFNIFDEDDGLAIVPVQNDALERAREIQEAADPGDEENRENRANPDPIIVPAEDNGPVVTGPDGSVEIVMPDVDAMIDEIAARATDPDRNSNADNDDRSNNDRNGNGEDRDGGRDRADNSRAGSPPENRRKSARERVIERVNRQPPPANNNSGGGQPPANEPVWPGNNGNGNGGECRNPFENIPEHLRPENFPFNNNC